MGLSYMTAVTNICPQNTKTQNTMCIMHAPSCRLCLSENLSEPYFFLLENVNHTEKYATILELQTNLYDANIHPNHVCIICKTALDKFVLLQQTSIRNEKFLLKYQELIKLKGLTEAKIQAYFKEEEEEEDRKDEESPSLQQNDLTIDHLTSFEGEDESYDYSNQNESSYESEDNEEDVE